MPESYAGISFNEEGVCNFCLTHRSHRCIGEDALKEMIHSLNRSGDYDCVVPLSGGKDSIFILYYAVKRLGLNAIAVNYDSLMQSDLAMENMRKACGILKVPLIIKRANSAIQRKRLKAMLRVSERVGAFVLGCGGCVPVLQAITIGYAHRNNIPLVLDGGSSIEHTPGSKNVKRKLNSKIESFMRYRFYNLDFLKYTSFLRYRYYNNLLNKEMEVSSVNRPPFGYVNPFDSGKTKVVRFSNYIRWPETEIINLISKELGWKNPEGKDKRFDCFLHCLSDFDSLSKYGITSNGIIYSNMIREGLMKREEAVLKEDYAKRKLTGECFELARKIGFKQYKIPKLG